MKPFGPSIGTFSVSGSVILADGKGDVGYFWTERGKFRGWNGLFSFALIPIHLLGRLRPYCVCLLACMLSPRLVMV